MAELDPDIRSIQEVRDRLRAAELAYHALKEFSQEQVDQICIAMAEAAREKARHFAELAHQETGYGRPDHKEMKNRFATDRVLEFILPLRTVGVIAEDRELGIAEIAVPVGIVAGITPSTNPTSTVIYKALISVKSRNPVVFAPHPRTRKCIAELCDLLDQAAVRAGAPRATVQSIHNVTLEGTKELMGHRLTGIILATGGTAMVRAAYSSGNPALGVGPGNVPAYIHQSANVEKAIDDIIASKTFDWGVICSSEQSIVVDRKVAPQAREVLLSRGCYFASREETAKLQELMFPGGRISPKIVGQAPWVLAEWAGFSIPEGTPMIVVEEPAVGRDYPLTREKLSPVICFWEVEDWREGCRRCIEIVNLGGVGHTLVVHGEDPEVIMAFALEKPVFRILVNTPASQGSIGLTTNLPPAMTLGSGTWGGSATSDNITPLHLINRKRLAYESVPWEMVRAKNGYTDKPLPTFREQGSLRPSPSRSMVGQVPIEEGGGAALAGTAPAVGQPTVVAGRPAGNDQFALSEEQIRRMVEDFLRRRRGG